MGKWIRGAGVSAALGITMLCSIGESASFQLTYDSRYNKDGTVQQYATPWLTSSVRDAGNGTVALDFWLPRESGLERLKSIQFAINPRLTSEELSLLSAYFLDREGSSGTAKLKIKSPKPGSGKNGSPSIALIKLPNPGQGRSRSASGGNVSMLLSGPADLKANDLLFGQTSGNACFYSVARFKRPNNPWPPGPGGKKNWVGAPHVSVPEPTTILGSLTAVAFFLLICGGRMRGSSRRPTSSEKDVAHPQPALRGTRHRISVRSVALASLVGFVIVFHMILVLREGGFGLLGVSTLCWVAVGYLLWNRRGRLRGESGTLATGLGALTVLSAFAPMLVSGPEERWVRVFPFVSALGISLMAGGLRGPLSHGRELLVLFFLGVPRVVLPWLLDLSNITAGVAAFLLHYTGHNVSLDGLRLSLDSGYVDVGGGCDGVEAITQTLALGVIFLLLVPVGAGRKVLVVAVTILAGFLSNALRVACLAVVANPSTQGLFEFWHQGAGSTIWMVLPVAALGCCCLWVVQRQKRLVAPCGPA